MDWTQHKNIKPYHENQEMARTYSGEDIAGVVESDVFVMIGNNVSTGAPTELGVAILCNLLYKKPKIYVIGELNTASEFYFHRAVNRRSTIEEVLKETEK